MNFPRHCPLCRSGHDREVPVPLGGQKNRPDLTPKNGDFGLCFDCGGLFVFDDKAHENARTPTPEEVALAEKNPIFTRAQLAWAANKGATRQ